MAKKKITNNEGGGLTEELVSSINKKFKDQGQVAYFLGGEDESHLVKKWISTGCLSLDLAISNRPHGGLPVGRIIELTGLEQSGKSLLAAHIVATTQQNDGITVYIDTESSLDAKFLTAIGVDVSKMIYISTNILEEAFETIEDVIFKIREHDKDKLVTIILDSVAAATTKIENAADYDKDGYATAKAIIMSKSMRKITNLVESQNILCVFTNQLRQKMNAPLYGDQYTTPGGKALQFHASVRLRLKGVGKIKEKVNGVETVVGQEVECEVVKNRVGPPLRKIRYRIYYDSGIDSNDGFLKMLKDYNIIKQGGAWYNYKIGDEEIKFLAKEFPDLLESHPNAFMDLYSKLCEKYIMKYRHEKEEDRDPENVITEPDNLDE